MFTTGFAIFLGLVFIFIKLPRRTMLRWLRYDALLDVAVTLIVLAIHFGQSLKGEDVQVLKAIVSTRGRPNIIKTDNGSEFVGKEYARVSRAYCA